MNEPKHVLHPFPPLYDENSKVLILGSFPSVKSREQMFFYGHPHRNFDDKGLLPGGGETFSSRHLVRNDGI